MKVEITIKHLSLIFIVFTLGKMILQYYPCEESFFTQKQFHKYKIEAIEQIERPTPFV